MMEISEAKFKWMLRNYRLVVVLPVHNGVFIGHLGNNWNKTSFDCFNNWSPMKDTVKTND